jgi:hypothetical protein
VVDELLRLGVADEENEGQEAAAEAAGAGSV